jgi:hypothetical protein
MEKAIFFIAVGVVLTIGLDLICTGLTQLYLRKKYGFRKPRRL